MSTSVFGVDIALLVSGIAGLDDDSLVMLADAIEDQLRQRADDGLVRVLRERFGATKRVHFATWQWEDGWFFNESHALVIDAGSGAHGQVEEDFSEDEGVVEALREVSSVARRAGGLYAASRITVDLVLGSVERGE